MSRADRLAQLGLRFTKGLPENIRDLVRARPTGFRYTLSDGRSDKAVPGLYLRVGGTGEGIFWLQYRVRLGRAKGERRQYHIGPVTLEAARREAKQVLGRVEGGADPWAEREAEAEARARARASTLGAFFEETYNPEKLAHTADGKGVAGRFRNTWGPLFGKPLAQITDNDVAAILAKRAAAGTKAGTLHRDFAVLRAAMNLAVRKNLLVTTPFKPDEERPRFLVALAEAPLFLQTIARLALATGMRRGNILGLTEAQLRGDHILIPGAQTKAGKDLAVYLNADSKRALAGWTLRGMKGELFPVSRFGGSKLTLERKVERAWAAVCRKAKVVNFHVHDCRHDFASRFLKAGASLVQVRDALGHSSIAMTERYAHLERRDLRAAIQAVTL